MSTEMTTDSRELTIMLLTGGDFIISEKDGRNSVFFKVSADKIEPLDIGGALLSDPKRAIDYNKNSVIATFNEEDINEQLINHYKIIIDERRKLVEGITESAIQEGGE